MRADCSRRHSRPGLVRVCEAVERSGGRVRRRRRRQEGSGRARNRDRALLNWFSQGQCLGAGAAPFPPGNGGAAVPVAGASIHRRRPPPQPCLGQPATTVLFPEGFPVDPHDEARLGVPGPLYISARIHKRARTTRAGYVTTTQHRASVPEWPILSRQPCIGSMV